MTASKTPGCGVVRGTGQVSATAGPFGQSPKALVTSARASSTVMSPTTPTIMRFGWKYFLCHASRSSRVTAPIEA